MTGLVLSHYTMVNALGVGVAVSMQALRTRRSGLRPCDFLDVALPTHIGRVDGVEMAALPESLRNYESRNNRLALMALTQDDFQAAVARARARYGADRIAVVVGTSTSGVLETESAYRRRDPDTGALPADFFYRQTQNIYSSGDFARTFLALHGPSFVVSTACSSSTKVFASAARLIQAGFCDAAVVGGVDSLCKSTLHGFSSLELTSSEPCRPCDAQRNGISVGEGAGFALLERIEKADQARSLLLGYGESADAYHMSTPHPEGLGAVLAMERALAMARLEADAIDYINLHGTATRINDAAEDKAVSRIFGKSVPCSSTKGWTGHALGAAGIIEAIFASVCMAHDVMPGNLNARSIDPSFASRMLLDNESRPLRTVMSNSFGFGGNNCSLILGAAT